MKKNKKIKLLLIIIIIIAYGFFKYEETHEGELDNPTRYEDNKHNGDIIINNKKTNDKNNKGFDDNSTLNDFKTKGISINYKDIPEYSGKDFTVINNNTPYFKYDEIEEAQRVAYEYYEDLDELGRATLAKASIDESIRPKKGEERQDISKVKPSGWNQAKYDFIPNGGWLYNRSHLIGYQLSGENDNPKNLITGTRHFNADSMLIFENMVADYLKGDSARRVLYRVTPVYKDNELVPRGVLMEAKNVDNDPYEDLEYCVFIYNVQGGIQINYLTGESSQEQS